MTKKASTKKASTKKTSIDVEALPEFARKQALSKLKGARFSARSGTYFGGSSSRRGVSTWSPPQGDADADTLTDRVKIICRSRDLIRNVPIATGAINTNQLHVIGTGLTMQSRVNRNVLNLSEDKAAELQENIESEWKLWANNLDCSYDRRANFADTQSLVLRSYLESGDVFCLLPFELRNTSPYGLKLQIIEGDRVCNKAGVRDTKTLAGGVHMDSKGAPIAYDIRTANPGSEKSFERKWETIPAFNKLGRRNILHIYERLRPDQTRGMPYLAPIIEIVKQLSKYTNAEIAAAVVNSYFTVFLKSETGTTGLSPFAMTAETNASSQDQDYKLGMGAFITLGANESVDFADPKRPNQNFEKFMQAMFQQIGVSLSIPYELLMYKFSSSYSAARASMLLAWLTFRTKRSLIVNHYCNPVYEAWFEEAVARGRIDAPGFMDDFAMRSAYLGAKWIGQSPGQIDPVKETTAALDRIAGRLTTIAGESAAIGEDFDANINQIAYEERVMREKGVSFVGQGARGGSGQAIINAETMADEGGTEEDIDEEEDTEEDTED
jgi:lambda family phage portal protein